MRPDLARDAPPTTLTVGGFSYNIDSDYRTWIDVMRLIRQLDPEPDEMKWRLENLRIEREIELKVFGGVLADENSADVMNAVTDFAGGYPDTPLNGLPTVKRQTYSLDWDINYIILAIRAQYGIDISYRCEYLHWWEFLLMFHGLCGDHYILRLMEVRGYDGKDREMMRAASRFALPKEYTKHEEEQLAELNAYFSSDMSKMEENDEV